MKRMRLLSACVALAAALCGCDYLLPPEEELLAPPLVEPAPVEYKTMEVALDTIEDVLTISASFVASRYATIAFEGGGGRVEEIPVAYGDEVKKGDLLIQLSSESIRRQIEQQSLVVQKAQLSYDTLLNETPGIERYDLSQIEKAYLDVDSARSKYYYLIEQEEIAIKGWHSNRDDLTQQREQALIALQKAEETLTALEENYNNWLYDQDHKPDKTAAIESARLELELQKLTLNNLKLDLDRTRLYAPINGIISYMDYTMQIGENVDGYVTLFRIADPTQLTIKYTGEHATKFNLGAQVRVDRSRESFPGVVVADPRSIPLSDGKMVNEVEFIVEGLDITQVALGDTVRVSYVLNRSEDVIVLPKNCINSFWGRKFVNVLVDDIKVERDVEVGIETSTQVEIKKGLEVGELIIIS